MSFNYLVKFANYCEIKYRNFIKQAYGYEAPEECYSSRPSFIDKNRWKEKINEVAYNGVSGSEENSIVDGKNEVALQNFITRYLPYYLYDGHQAIQESFYEVTGKSYNDLKKAILGEEPYYNPAEKRKYQAKEVKFNKIYNNAIHSVLDQFIRHVKLGMSINDLQNLVPPDSQKLTPKEAGYLGLTMSTIIEIGKNLSAKVLNQWENIDLVHLRDPSNYEEFIGYEAEDLVNKNYFQVEYSDDYDTEYQTEYDDDGNIISEEPIPAKEGLISKDELRNAIITDACKVAEVNSQRATVTRGF